MLEKGGVPLPPGGEEAWAQTQTQTQTKTVGGAQCPAPTRSRVELELVEVAQRSASRADARPQRGKLVV